jgi:hypothetical protein
VPGTVDKIIPVVRQNVKPNPQTSLETILVENWLRKSAAEGIGVRASQLRGKDLGKNSGRLISR